MIASGAGSDLEILRRPAERAHRHPATRNCNQPRDTAERAATAVRKTWHGPVQWGLQAVKGAGAMPRLHSRAVPDTRAEEKSA
jgi:hypothetical protein